MNKSREKINFKKRLKIAIFGLFLFIIMVLPGFAVSSKKTHLYVDHKVEKSGDGSASHPYRTITEAINNAKDKTEIHVAKGEYEENITLRKGVKLFGEDKEKTVIKAKKERNETVSMKNNSTIDGFTIKNGKMGIWIEKDAEASIINCIIKNNDDDGIGIEGGNTKRSNQVSISKTKIKDNGWSGIYSAGERRISITDSEISENKKDGIDLARGVSAWMENNSIRNNRGSGMKLVIDQSNFWTKKNDIRENGREGIEVASFGGQGRIDISKTKIVKNGLYGIARLQRSGQTDWNQFFTFSNQSEIWENRAGNISNVIYIK